MSKNIILNTDSYKSSHFLQYPPKTTGVYSYIESRGGVFPRTLFFGLQAYILQNLCKTVTKSDVEFGEHVLTRHGLPFNKEGWMYIVNKLGGYLPLKIKAVAEGLVVPTHNVLVTVENTDPNCAWLTSYVETSLLRGVWYPTTVATVSWHAKQMIKAAMEKSCDNLDGLPFKLHDFGARGVSSEESAAIGGAAHLVNFMGTDTLSAIPFIWNNYNDSLGTSEMPGFSIPAMEHSTVTAWGKYEETQAYNNMLKTSAKLGGLVACVSDSYDLWNAVSYIWGDALREEVIASGATVVIRPDSGDPLTVPVKCIEMLGEKFGFIVNSKGYKVLPNCVRVIQGDGITIESIPLIINNLLASGWSMDNLAFGMGGGLLQQVNRDTQKFAMKASAIKFGSEPAEWMPIGKDPVTDSGKKSKQGRFALINDLENGWKTVPYMDVMPSLDKLKTVFEDGEIMSTITFNEVRKNSELT